MCFLNVFLLYYVLICIGLAKKVRETDSKNTNGERKL